MRLKRMCLVVVLILAIPGLALAADLKVTDSRGTEVMLKNASIDYGGFLGSEKETRGIRVLQGEGVVFVLWEKVVSITVVRRDTSVKPARIELEILLKNGQKAPAELLRQGNMRLLGATDLGDYSIDLEKVRSIAPVASR